LQKDFEDAQNNFLRTLSAYSLFCYFLQIKDRHNGNIMLDSKGNLLHIDFGYLLGRTMKFEKAPFKLTEDFVEVLGGEKSKLFKKYVNYCVDGFLAIRKNYEKILLLVEMTLARPSMEGQFLPCLEKDSVIRNLRKRFRLEWNTEQVRELVTNLIREARDNWRTNIYDTYQRILNDIY
jgi:phosphatidylinositol 4-kinase